MLAEWMRGAIAALEQAGLECRLAIALPGKARPRPPFDRIDRAMAAKLDARALAEIDARLDPARGLPGAAHLSLPDWAQVGPAIAARDDIALVLALDCGPDVATTAGDDAVPPPRSEASPTPRSDAMPARWRLSLSAHRDAAGAPTGYTERVRADEVTEVAVFDQVTGQALRRRRFATHRFSWNMNRVTAERMAAGLLVDTWNDHRRGIVAEQVVQVDRAPDAIATAGVSIGASLGSLARAVRLGLRGPSWRLRGLQERWYVLLGRRGGDGRISPRAFEPVVPPAGWTWADPFLLRDADGLHLVVEEIRTESRHGHLAVLSRDGAGAWQSRPILELDHHLSYPYLFRHDGQTWMIPEAGRAREIPLYRMGADRYEWHREAPLMTGVDAVDSSLLWHEGRVWLFTSIRRGGDDAHYGELHLFHADRFPTDRWTPHPANPVICDPRSARMGGGFIREGDALLRVAQASACGHYGLNIALRRIVRLDPLHYVEEAAGAVHPDWAPRVIGTHHLNALDADVVIDARRLVRARSSA